MIRSRPQCCSRCKNKWRRRLPAPPALAASEIELLALIHIGRDVTESRRFHHIELGLEHARGVLVLVCPLEPDRHGDTLEFLKIRNRQPVNLRSGLDELRPG